MIAWTSDAWLDAFEAQLTSRLIAKARRHANWCLFRYRLDRRGHGYEHDVVQAALADIFERRIEWRPAEEALLAKVCDVIKYRVRDEKDSLAGRTHHDDLDEAGGNNEDGEGDDDEDGRPSLVPQALIESRHPEAMLSRERRRAAGAQLGSELAALAAGDEHVEAIVRCLRQGITRRVDVLAETQMSAVDYHNAVRRFGRLTRQLSPDLRALAEEDDQ